ncbi:MAG: sugar ABC transporter permease [Thermomicrobiales bacterium]|nr:sugar ABC transporter permease [Thermomicrobiales bacterium]
MSVRSLPLATNRPGRWQAVQHLWQIPEQRLALLLLLPSLLVVLLTMLYPLIVTIRMALSSERGQFVGLGNLTRLATTNIFLESMSFTLRFSAFVVIVSLLLGLGLALVVNSIYVPMKTLWITILIIPLMVSDIVSAVVWRLMYHPTIGILNYALSLVGLPRVDWLGKSSTAFFSVGIIEIWRSAPFFFIMLYAALQLIPPDVYESASVDGAGGVRAFFDMTLPYLRPVMTVALMLQFIGATRAFGIIVGATEGGPGRATWTISYFIYRYAFRAQQMHFASAAVLVLVLLTIVAGVLFFRFVWVQRDAA